MSNHAENVPDETQQPLKQAGALQTCLPIIPNSVVSQICSSAGLVTTDVRILQSIALASQVYMANITNGAMVHCKTRLGYITSPGQPKQHFKDAKLLLTMEDLSPALNDCGIVCKKPPSIV